MEARLNDFRQYAERVRTEIDAALDAATQWDDDCPARLREAIRYSLLAPGKRLRPLLVLMAAESCGCERWRAMPAACAVEMVHAYSLIHDDLPAMDDDDLRRGRPSCHARFDEATAILAGDALLARSFEVLAEQIEPAQLAMQCCRELGRAAGATALVGGQADDLDAERRDTAQDDTAQDDGDLVRLRAIHRRKTGALLAASLRLGGIVAGAGESQLAALHEYGRNLGMAFQIVDDLLDLQGHEHDLGKRTGKDGARGKLTFPRLMGAEASRREAARLIGAARGALHVFDSGASILDELAQFVLERKH